MLAGELSVYVVVKSSSNKCAPTLPYVDLEWQIVYVGSASSEAHDQTLDSVLVGPVSAGRHRFVFQVCKGWLYYSYST